MNDRLEPAILRLENVSKDFVGPGETVHAVSEASIAIDAGEFVTLLGPSGSGKSTLLQLAAGIFHPDQGRVVFDGRVVSEFGEREAATYRRSTIGFIFQNFNLMPGSAAENVALQLRLGGVKPREALVEARQMLRNVGLENRIDHPAAKLSGGERQRVAIARALVHSPSLVLADEPTGNLDSERGDQVLAMLSAMCAERKIAVLVVTHDERANQYATRTYRMKDGRILSDESAGRAESSGARAAG